MRLVAAVVAALVAGAANARLGAEAPDGGGAGGVGGARSGAEGSSRPGGSNPNRAEQDSYAHKRSHPEGAHVGPHYIEFTAPESERSDENPVDGYRPSYVPSGYFRERVEHENMLREARARAVASSERSVARRQICRLCMSTITMGRVLVEEERGLRDAENLINLTATTCPLMKAQYGAFLPKLDCHSLLSRVQHYYDPRFEGEAPQQNSTEGKRVNFALVHLLHDCNTYMGIDFCPASEVTSDRRWRHWARFLGTDPFERAVAKAEAEVSRRFEHASAQGSDADAEEPYLRDGRSPEMHPVVGGEPASGEAEQSLEPATTARVGGSPTGGRGFTVVASESRTRARVATSSTEVVRTRHRTVRKRVTVEEETLSPPAKPERPAPTGGDAAKGSQAPEQAATGPSAENEEPEEAVAATAPAATAPAATAPATGAASSAPAATAATGSTGATGSEASGPEEAEAEADAELEQAQAKLDALEEEAEEKPTGATGAEEMTPATAASGTQESTSEATGGDEELEQGGNVEETADAAEATAATGSTAEPSPAPAALLDELN